MNQDQYLDEDLKERTAALLLDLHAHLTASLVKSGKVSEANAADFAREAVEHIRKTYGGGLFYIPKGKGLDTCLQHHAIFREFNGRNQAALARKYGVSQQWVYTVIRQVQQRLKHKIQPELFD